MKFPKHKLLVSIRGRKKPLPLSKAARLLRMWNILHPLSGHPTH